MGLTEPGDESVVGAAARELNNIMAYRGLNNDQMMQALVAVSAAVLSVVSKDDKEILDANLKMFCGQVRTRARAATRRSAP